MRLRGWLLGFLVLWGLAGCDSEVFTGKVAVKGNEPHTYLALVTPEGGEFALIGKEAERIRANYQGSFLKITGRIIHQGTGPGFPPQVEVERILEVRSP